MFVFHPCFHLADLDKTCDFERLRETKVSYTWGRSLHQSGLDSVVSHHRRK